MRIYAPKLIGTIPYVATGATTVYLAHMANMAANGIATNIDPGVALTLLDQALNIQVTYGAVILSFLGKIRGTAPVIRKPDLSGYQAPCIGEWRSLVTADIKGIVD